MEISITRISDELGGKAVFGHRVQSKQELVNHIREGLPYQSLRHMMARYGIVNEEIVKPIGISVATIKRRKPQDRLSASASNNLLCLAQITTLASEVLGSEEKATRWLHKSNRSLSGDTPLSRLDTAIGYKEVEAILQRIAYGVFS